MVEGTVKREPKKDVCHFAIVLKVLFQKWFRVKEQNQRRRRSRLSSHMRKKEEKNSKGEVHRKQETSKPCTYFSF
jgi:translation initiation factor IF-1